ncbi:MAG: Cof-type HAD-IIB family hydrolase [Gordonia sp. (in: high G+C Gram-positive bacteria)]|uniref:Cof-type HAD-IIB family hydrolase n=1 Tax=Gordonia sp. (in: high G+C Gram-positive bacteria) TaxID=84139 RepID=UPI0039E52075
MTAPNPPAARPDVRLVVSDMDGTLLTPEGAVPAAFWPLLETMRNRGIRFVPASGRQYYTLEKLFARAPEGISYIAENGNLVVHDGRFRASTTVEAALVHDVIAAVRASARNLGIVVCGTRGAVVERDDDPFLAECAKYYARLDLVDDLLAVDDDVLKLAIYDFDDAAAAARQEFDAFADRCRTVVSGPNWIDLMAPGVDKGIGVRALQAELGVTPAQTVVFGDYLNDLEMLDAADWSFAMADAHPQVRERARYQAPANADQGVITVLTELLGGQVRLGDRA